MEQALQGAAAGEKVREAEEISSPEGAPEACAYAPRAARQRPIRPGCRAPE
jgi:hypothetical protein